MAEEVKETVPTDFESKPTFESEPTIDDQIAMLKNELDAFTAYAARHEDEIRKKLKKLREEKEMQECMASIRDLKRHLTSAGIPEDMQNDFIMDSLRKNLDLPSCGGKKLVVDRVQMDAVDALENLFRADKMISEAKKNKGEFRC